MRIFKNWGVFFTLFFLLNCEGYAQSVAVEPSTKSPNSVVPSVEIILRQKISQNPRDLDSLSKLLTRYRKMGKLRTAGSLLSRTLEKNPEIPLDYIKQGINDALAARDYLRVIEFTRAVNAKESENAENLGFMGFAFYNLRQYGLARSVLEMSVHLNGQNYRTLTNLARTLEVLGNSSRAKEFYQRALEINPNYQLAKRNLAKLQQKGFAKRKDSTSAIIPKKTPDRFASNQIEEGPNTPQEKNTSVPSDSSEQGVSSSNTASVNVSSKDSSRSSDNEKVSENTENPSQ